MLETGGVPRADWLSYTMAGRPWADFEWLCQLLWYGLWRAAGPWGLLALKASLFSASAALLWRGLELYGTGLPGRCLALLAWTSALIPGNDLRPENFSLLLFSLLFFHLERRRLAPGAPARAGPEENARRLGAAVFFALWANLHAGFPYGLALLGVYAGAESWRSRSARPLWILPCAAAGALANPYGWRVYAVLLEHLGGLGALQEYLSEWHEPSLLNPWHAAFWAVLAASFAAVLTRHLRERAVPAEHLLALCFYAWSAGAYVRTTMYFVLVAVPVAACHLPAALRSARGRAGDAAAVVLATALLPFCLRPAPALLRLQPFLPRFVPVRLAGFLESEKAVLGGRRMLNPWHWGGYLGWKLYPDYRVFVDGRYIFHGFLEPMHQANRSPQAAREFLAGHGIDLVLQQRLRAFFPMPAELAGGAKKLLMRPYYLFFLPRAEWALVYWDGQGLVFVRRSSVPASWLESREFRVFRPDDEQAAELLLREGLASKRRLSSEIERFLRLSGEAEKGPPLKQWLEGIAPLPGRGRG